jgi:predicted Ser/Thr protein kinase
MGTKCPLCLSDNPDQSKFCAECGTKLSSLEDAQLTRTLTPNTALKGLTKGKVFAGKYMILDEIGRGGMGVVLEAKDMRLKRTVALKFLPLELSQYEEAKARFIREAQAAAALSHPNICTVHEVEEADGQPYIAMEYVQGRTLRQLAAKGPLDVDTVTDLSVQVASGLEAAHQRGIVHRDIKSANIMVTDKGQAKIMDFGLAKVAGELQITKVAGTMGTVAYMSPEQAQGEDLDRRTDIWSFGVVLYEMLTGQLPFRGERDSIVLHSITGAEPKPLRQIKADIPAELQKIIDRALKKKREERYASAAEMAADLRAYLERRRAEEAGFFNLRSLARRMRKPAYFIPAAAVLVALGFLTYSFIQRNAHVRWAREIALPQVEKSIQADNFTAAYTLAKEAAKYIPKDPDLSDALGQVTAFATVSTYPPGAQFFVKDYKTLEDDYEFIGLTPLDKVPYPNGYKRWKIVKDGYEPVEGAGYDLSGIKAKLDVKGSLPPGMVRIQPSAEFEAPLDGTEKLPAVRLEEYLLDRYEVTNRRYKEFMDAGGYRRPEFWKEKFVRDGKEIPWTEAIKSFVDKTGRLGPATWEFGAYPNEQDDYPVSGVSWYEAAAYAEFAGKSLPTIYHWRRATPGPQLCSTRAT